MEHILTVLVVWIVMAVITAVWFELHVNEASFIEFMTSLLQEKESQRLARLGIFVICLLGWPVVMLILLTRRRRVS